MPLYISWVGFCSVFLSSLLISFFFVGFACGLRLESLVSSLVRVGGILQFHLFFENLFFSIFRIQEEYALN
jgi:hypothetical protein